MISWSDAAASDDVTCVLPADTSAPRSARQHLTEHCAHLPVYLVDDARLLVSELVTNAVLHGEPDITMRLRLQPASAGVAVHDTGTKGIDMAVTSAPFDQTHGRGLTIVEALASSWGVEVDADGRLVWFELRAGPAPR